MATVNSQFRFYSVTEAAAMLGLTDGRVRQLLLGDEIVGHKLGGTWAIPAAELKRFKAAREKNQRAATPEPVKT